MSAAAAPPVKITARLRKAAIVLCALSDEQAAAVLEHLPPNEVDALTAAVAAMRGVGREEERKVVGEYLKGLAGSGAPAGVERARLLIQRTFEPGEAARHLARLDDDAPAAEGGPFAFIAEAGAARVLPFLREEHPQTQALILSCLDSRTAAEVLTGLPPRSQPDVLRRLAALEPVTAAAAGAVSDSLERRVAAGADTARGGVEAVDRILLAAGRRGAALRRTLHTDLPGLRQAASRRAAARSGGASGADLHELFAAVPAAARGVALARVPAQAIARALRAAPPELGDVLLKALPEGQRTQVRSIAQGLGPVKVTEAEQALQAVRSALQQASEVAR